MKNFVLGLLFCSGVMVSSTSQAQLLKKIQNAAIQGVENSAAKKVEEGAQKKTDNALEGMLGSMLEPANTESSYSFSGFMVMEILTTDKKGKTDKPVRINYFLSKEPDFMGMAVLDPDKSGAVTTTIMDTKNSAMVILINDGKTKSSMAMKTDYEKIQGTVDEEAENQLENPDYKIEKTGNKKTILGYSCDEYLVTTDDGNARYWITEEPIDGLSMFSPQSNPMVSDKTMDRYSSLFSNAPKGSFMEMIFTDTNGNVTDMKVVELQTDKPQTFSMAEYPNMMKQ